MNPPIPIYLAVEDDLSEWVLRRLLSERCMSYAVESVFKRQGFGYLKERTPAFNNIAKSCPVLMLTDLDQQPCAPGLLENWLRQPRHPDFLFRVAVREVEAWLLADNDAFLKFLRLRRKWNLADPEALPDPKAELLNLAYQSPRREIREALVRRNRDGKLWQGPAYNSTLAAYVFRDWQTSTAAAKCSSLSGLLMALTELETKAAKR